MPDRDEEKRVPADRMFDLETLLNGFTDSFANAAVKLGEKFQDESWNQDFVYHMPRMNLSVEMSLTYSSSKVKGVLFSKKSQDEASSVNSRVEIEVLAVPRSGG